MGNRGIESEKQPRDSLVNHRDSGRIHTNSSGGRDSTDPKKFLGEPSFVFQKLRKHKGGGGRDGEVGDGGGGRR